MLADLRPQADTSAVRTYLAGTTGKQQNLVDACGAIAVILR